METPSRVNVDETQSKINGEIKRLYAAIGIEPKLPLEVNVYSSRGTDPAAAFFHRLTEKHNIADTEFLVGGMGYLTTLARRDLSGQLNYTGRKYIGDFLNAHYAHQSLPLLLAG